MAARTALAVTVAVAALSSGWLVRRELDRSRIGDGTATAATVALLAAWLVLPGADFGQRDHFVAILVLPYLVRAAERAARGSGGGDRIGAVLAGLLAGFAVAIKPHYLPALILVETWALLRAGGVRQGLDPAPAATAAVLVAAGADLMLRHPAFIRDILPAALTALEAYGGSPVRLLEPNSLMLSAVALGLGALLALDRRILGLGREARARAISFGLGCIGLWLAFLLQGKGWWYQAQPANVFFLMAAAMAVVGLASDADAAVLSHRRLARGAAAALLALGLLNEALAAVLSLQDTGMRRDLTARLVAAIRETEASAPVAAFSTSMYPTFPAVLEADADWVLEAIVEQLEPKRALLARVDTALAGRDGWPFHGPGGAKCTCDASRPSRSSSRSWGCSGSSWSDTGSSSPRWARPHGISTSMCSRASCCSSRSWRSPSPSSGSSSGFTISSRLSAKPRSP